MMELAGQPKFARIWRGRTVRAKADDYQHYLLQNGIAPLEARGAIGVQMFRDDRETETEFMTISYWESVEAMTAGSKDVDPRRPHHLERDAEFLVELPQTVQILTVLETRGRCTLGL
jgi:heme-degrading monooxygenase HmoA